jgi:hypothetical protein
LAAAIIVDVGEQHGIDLAEPRVVRPAHRETGVIQDPRAVGILENHCAIPRA